MPSTRQAGTSRAGTLRMRGLVICEAATISTTSGWWARSVIRAFCASGRTSSMARARRDRSAKGRRVRGGGRSGRYDYRAWANPELSWEAR